VVKCVHQIRTQVLRFECTVGFQAAGEGGGVQPFLGDFGQPLLKSRQIFFSQRATSGHGVAAKSQ
jgi:hypothetical protein